VAKVMVVRPLHFYIVGVPQPLQLSILGTFNYKLIPRKILRFVATHPGLPILVYTLFPSEL